MGPLTLQSDALTTRPLRSVIMDHIIVGNEYHTGKMFDNITDQEADKTKKGKGSPYSTAERRVVELIPVLGSQPAGDKSHKPGGRLPLLSSRPAVTLATLKRAATNFAAW